MLCSIGLLGGPMSFCEVFPLPLILCRSIPFKIPFDRRTILHSILHGTRKPLGHNGYAHTSTYYFTHFQKLNFFLIVKLYNIQIV